MKFVCCVTIKHLKHCFNIIYKSFKGTRIYNQFQFAVEGKGRQFWSTRCLFVRLPLHCYSKLNNKDLVQRKHKVNRHIFFKLELNLPSLAICFISISRSTSLFSLSFTFFPKCRNLQIPMTAPETSM